MEQYFDLSHRILKEGVNKSSGREGMPDTKSVFGHLMRFNLQEGFPLMTTKKVNLTNILVELIWFLKGDTNIKFLIDNNCNIWNDDAYRWYCQICNGHLNGGEFVVPILYADSESFAKAVEDGEDVDMNNERFGFYKLGDLGGVYGEQWRKWKIGVGVGELVNNSELRDLQEKATTEHLSMEEQTLLFALIEKYVVADRTSYIDQIADLIKGLRENPYGRRHIVTAWNPVEVPTMALPPCHLLSHFNCRPATIHERDSWAWDNGLKEEYEVNGPMDDNNWHKWHDEKGVPNVVLDCLLYQRS